MNKKESPCIGLYANSSGDDREQKQDSRTHKQHFSRGKIMTHQEKINNQQETNRFSFEIQSGDELTVQYSILKESGQSKHGFVLIVRFINSSKQAFPVTRSHGRIRQIQNVRQDGFISFNLGVDSVIPKKSVLSTRKDGYPNLLKCQIGIFP